MRLVLCRVSSSVGHYHPHGDEDGTLGPTGGARLEVTGSSMTVTSSGLHVCWL